MLIKGGLANLEQPTNICNRHRSAIIECLGSGNIFWSESLWPSSSAATSTRCSKASSGPLAVEVAFELTNRGKDREYQSSRRRGSVELFREALELNALLFHPISRLNHMLQGPEQSIHPPDDQDIPRTKMGTQLFEPRPCRLGSTDRISIDVLRSASNGSERIEL